MSEIIQPDQWEWFGNVGHFICGQWCRFHLTTKVGPWLVSTIGEYVHPRRSMGSEQTEIEWLRDNWPGEDIGYNRKYETMVFHAGDPCSAPGCNCGMPTISGDEEVSEGCNDAKAATEGHMRFCRQFAGIPEPEDMPKVEPRAECSRRILLQEENPGPDNPALPC